MNIRDLEYLLALEQTRHYGKAAEKCYVSQPTLSAQLKKLEKSLGVSLIDRNAKGVIFSEAGKNILEHAKNILLEVDQIQEISKHFKDPKSGALRIGIIPTIGPYLLPHVIQKLKRQFPNLNFYLHEKKTDQIVEALQERTLDLGILALSLEETGLEEVSLYHESFLLALSKQHPKAKQKHVSDTWLQHENLLLLEDGHCFRNQALSYCKQHHMQENINFRATSMETLKSMIEIGEGITAVPELAALAWNQKSDNIQFLNLPNPIPQRDVGLVFPKHSIRRDLYIEISNVISKLIKTKLIKTKKDKQLIPLN
jgi:LysR family hydrogen peroxide-inducible transcriptional activator